MVNERILSILRELMAAKTPLTSSYLGNTHQVTSRTVRNDIKQLDEMLSGHGASVVSLKGKGYQLDITDKQSFQQYLQKLSNLELIGEGILPSSPEERVRFLITRLLLTSEFIKLEDLADEIYVSKSTVQNDLKDIKTILKKYSIILEARPHYGLRLKGTEAKLRYCISDFLFNYERNHVEQFNKNLPTVRKEEMKIIKTIILKQIKINKVSLSDIALNNLVIHLAIACERIKSNHYVSLFPHEVSNLIKQKEYKVAMSIASEIEVHLGVSFPQFEVAYITVHLLGTKMILNTLGEKGIKTVIPQEIIRLTTAILDEVEGKLNLGIRYDEELFMGINLHLKPAINRYRFGMNLRNPVLQEIKTNFPLAFEAGVLAGMVLKREISAEIDENEVGYIALHIGAAIERKNIKRNTKKCMIVCASGIGSSQLLYYKLKSKFGDRMEIIGTTEYYNLQHISLQGLDFLISTLPIPEKLGIPVIEVNTILGEKDYINIERQIFIQTPALHNYTDESLVFLQKDFKTKEEVILFLGDQLKSKGLVDEHFIDSVFERESLSPTCYGNLVAIPHTMNPQTQKTFWAICTLKKPIMWAHQSVQFVCLLSVKQKSKEDLQKMYDLLLKIVDDKDMIQQLLQCSTYQMLTNVFNSSTQ